MIIFGTGGLAQVIAGYVGLDRVDAFTVDADYVRALEILERPVVPFEEIQDKFPPSKHSVLVAVTQQNGHRDLMKQKCIEAWDKGYDMPAFVHRSAIVSSRSVIGSGSIICPGVIIEAGVEIGAGVIVRSGAYIGHHCELGRYAYVAPRASMSGYVKVWSGAFIGNNATIRDRVSVYEGAVVGAGAVVLRDVAPNEVYQGYPARLLSVRGDEVEI